MSTRPDSNSGETDGPSNVLLVTPTVGDCEQRACGELAKSADPKRSHVVFAACLESPRQRLAAWDDHVDVRPAETTVVDVSTTARSAAAATADDTELWTDVTVEEVPDDDLLALGHALDRALTEGDQPPFLCVHSVSDLLQSSDRERVFKFLEVLTRSVERTGGIAHYHLTPDVHDAETVRTLEVLFDAVLDLRGTHEHEP